MPLSFARLHASRPNMTCDNLILDAKVVSNVILMGLFYFLI